VHKWDIKFSGDKKNFAVLDFIRKVKALAKAQRISEKDLYDSAYHLFEGDGELWYEANMPYCASWEEFEARLREDFLPDDYDQEIELKILSTKQNEPFAIYHAKLEQLFSKLSKPKSEKYKLKILQKNLCLYYQEKIVTVKPKCIRDLAAICREIEKLIPDDFWKPKRRERIAAVKDFRTNASQDEVEDKNVVSSVRNTFVCWNCDGVGHSFKKCNRPKKLFCYGCGKKGVTVKTCEPCNPKNK
jgi:hypothetical protein